MRTVLWFLLVLSGCQSYKPAGWTPSGYRFPDAPSVSILSWNIEHFVDRFDDPYVRNRIENEAKFSDEKLALFASVVKKADADVLVFQEVENQNIVKHVADSLFPELGYRFFASNKSSDWYQNVVIASRLPLGPVTGFGTVHSPVYQQADSSGNPITQSQINTRIVSVCVQANADYSFQLTGVHLKAGRGTL